MSQLYSIQLLNDLHAYFPDILYRPERFRNIQDLLQYINQVAQVNPYDRGLTMYNRHVTTPNQWEMNDEIDYDSLHNILSNRMVYIPTATNVTNNTSAFSRILRSMLGNSDIPDLENVVVRPTTEHITNATTVYRVNTLQDDICTICQDNIQLDEVRCIRKCHHYFHRTCIDTWLQESVYCPTCRHDIREV